MANIKTELKWRKKSTFTCKSLNNKYDRYILVCGMIVFVEYNGSGMVYSKPAVISEREFPARYNMLENDYINAVIEEPLSKQEVSFVR